MGIIKNEIPILEFDPEQTAVISPDHENLNLKLPKKCVFAFLGNYIDEYANKSDTKQVSSFMSETKSYPIYVTKYKGEEIVLCQAPVGVAAAAQILDWLIGYGVCEIISAGGFTHSARNPEGRMTAVKRQLWKGKFWKQAGKVTQLLWNITNNSFYMLDRQIKTV